MSIKNFSPVIRRGLFYISAISSMLVGAEVLAITVTASGSDGNLPENTLDNNLNTRWSANGNGQWIQYDLGSSFAVESLDIGFYKGDQRSSTIAIQTSTNGSTWQTVFDGNQPSSTSAQQNIDVVDSIARYVRILGYGNTSNSWNSITEVDINTAPLSSSSSSVPSSSLSASASTHDGNVPGNVLDGRLDTRWSANGSGEWLQLDLGSIRQVGSVSIAFYSGTLRTASFDIQTSANGSSWTTVLSGATSSGATNALESFDVAKTNARYVRYVGYGNNTNSWNSLTEVAISTEDSPSSSSSSNSTSSSSSSSQSGAIPPGLYTNFIAEGRSPYVNDSYMVFKALEEKYTTPNGNGWRHELKLTQSMRQEMSKNYEYFKADVKVDLSKGGKLIALQYHAEGTGTIVKVYVSDTDESGFMNSVAKDGIFDVYVRMSPASGGGEQKYALGTIKTGDTFTLTSTNDYGTVTVSAFSRSKTLKVAEGGASYLKFGNYLQSQNPVGSVKCTDFAACYAKYGITVSTVTMTNVSYARQ